MAVFALAGKVYLAPTQVDGASGTLLTGILEDRIEFDDGSDVEVHGSGLEADAWTTVRVPRRPPALYLPLHNVDANTYKLLMMLASTGTGLDSSGGNSVGLYGMPPSYSLVIRPLATAYDNYWYSPRVTLHPESVKKLVWARNTKRFEGSNLILLTKRSLDGTKQAWKEGTYAALNTAYSLP
jgi:hypothetical protein